MRRPRGRGKVEEDWETGPGNEAWALPKGSKAWTSGED